MQILNLLAQHMAQLLYLMKVIDINKTQLRTA